METTKSSTLSTEISELFRKHAETAGDWCDVVDHDIRESAFLIEETKIEDPRPTEPRPEPPKHHRAAPPHTERPRRTTLPPERYVAPSKEPANLTVSCWNICEGATKEEVFYYFHGDEGVIKDLYLIGEEKETKIGCILFTSPEAAERALQLNNEMFMGRKLRVTRCKQNYFGDRNNASNTMAYNRGGPSDHHHYSGGPGRHQAPNPYLQRQNYQQHQHPGSYHHHQQQHQSSSYQHHHPGSYNQYPRHGGGEQQRHERPFGGPASSGPRPRGPAMAPHGVRHPPHSTATTSTTPFVPKPRPSVGNSAAEASAPPPKKVPAAPKPNPFGAAAPVDTSKKMLDLFAKKDKEQKQAAAAAKAARSRAHSERDHPPQQRDRTVSVASSMVSEKPEIAAAAKPETVPEKKEALQKPPVKCPPMKILQKEHPVKSEQKQKPQQPPMKILQKEKEQPAAVPAPPPPAQEEKIVVEANNNVVEEKVPAPEAVTAVEVVTESEVQSESPENGDEAAEDAADESSSTTTGVKKKKKSKKNKSKKNPQRNVLSGNAFAVLSAMGKNE